MKAERAVEKVHDRLLRTSRALEGADISYAVIGGNAVAIWVASVDEGAVRNTKDVDILLNRADMDRAIEAMSQAGFDMTVVDGVTMFLDRNDPMPSRGIHVVFVGEKIRPHYAHPAPQLVNLHKDSEGVSSIGLYELLMMKLQSYRDLDRVHVRDLLSVGLINDKLVEQLPTDLRARLEEILANPDS